ncbi:aminotransferase class I/II-fold pyridoxal phosphate-dependent enzyme [Haladaptatus caseinilyticus]|uniref:aminotransferase class I/II-fold pyridoxal phosphate-dependent enzyme n=1 Tax=Haladaptatus caseinilyticus TaxID=2993314 RepID=UPI00224AFEBC|nr:8-amino-7-oxononanoate synthase [Haladaptatus caseinilyticus]
MYGDTYHGTGSNAEADRDNKRGFDLSVRLAEREQQTLKRNLTPVDQVAACSHMAPDPKGLPPEYGDENQLVFAANNYLGLTVDKRVQQAAATAAREIGTGAGASRLVTGDTQIHRALERDIAETKNTERSLVFSSGYVTNVGVLSALNPDVIISDELNHASIIDGCRLTNAETLVYDHCDPESLHVTLEQRAREGNSDESWLIVTDSVFSMDGDIAPLRKICTIVEEFDAWLMVDEAHATGLYEDGGGIVQHEGLSDRIHIQMGTLSKAFASQGGYVAGSEDLIEYLLNAARSFVFSTGLAPPAAAAAREALSIARSGDRSAQLWRNVEWLRDGLEEMGYEVWGETQILPVIIGNREDTMALDDRLREQNVVAPGMRPPTVPEGTSRIRVAPMASHTNEDIDRCLTAFRKAGRDLDLL